MSQALSFLVTADTSQLVANLVQAGQATETQGKRIERALQYATAELKRVTSAQKAANDAGAEVTKTAANMEHFGFQTASAKRELLVLAHELSQGNYSRFGGSLLVLAERTNAMELAFSSAGAVIGITAAIVGGAAAALAIGSHEAEEFRKSLILTGNAAGVTSSSFDKMAANAAAATDSTIGRGRDALQTLISTGRIGQQNIEAATTATLLMEKLTGQSAEEISRDFAKMSDGVAKWAAEHNRQYHYITAAQFEYIKSLEDQGRASDAMAENLRLWNERNKQVLEQLGYLERAWKAVRDMAADGWDAMKGVGRGPSTAEQLSDARARLEAMQARGPLNSMTGAAYDKGVERLRQEIYLLQEKARLEQRNADAQARVAAQEQKKIEGLTNPPNAAKIDEAYLRRMAGGGESAGDLKKMIEGDLAGYSQADLLKLIEHGQYTNSELFDKIHPAADVSKILKYQSDNADARRQFFEQEYKDGEALAKKFETPQPHVKSALQSYFEAATDESARAQALIVGGLHAAEDAFIEFARTGKLNIGSLFAYFAEAMLRAKFETAAAQLITLGGGPKNFSFSTLFSAAGDWFAGFGHSSGLEYVPYDGYPAILHRGERVQTALEASSTRGGGTVVHIDASIGSVGAGTSRAEVAAALAQQRAQILGQFRRMQQQGLAS